MAYYDFAGNFSDEENTSTLTAFSATPDSENRANTTSNFGSDSGLDGDSTYWGWTSTASNGGGFWIDVDGDISANYTIGLRFSFEDVSQSWNRILDFKNASEDYGFYFYYNELRLFPYSSTSATSFSNNQVMDLVVTRNSSTQTFTAYYISNNEILEQIEFADSSNVSQPVLVNNNTRFGFFYDDGNGEATSGGKVYAIRIWDDVLPLSAITTAIAPPANPPELLQGTEGPDVLNGFGPNYQMQGGAGDDLYQVDGRRDSVVENPDGGQDQVMARISWTLEDNVENLTLTTRNLSHLGRLGAKAQINTLLQQQNPAVTGQGNALDNSLTGNRFANTLSGDDGADTLAGGLGADTLTGGAGGDTFRYNHWNQGGDSIDDFSASQGDRLLFFSPNFGALASGSLATENYVANSNGVATSDQHRFVLNTTSGQLWYDPDGTGSTAAMALVTLGSASLTAGDIWLTTLA